MALDDLLLQIGEFGRYQWYLFFLASLATVGCPAALFSQIFFTAYTPHWCNVDVLNDADCQAYGLEPVQCQECQRNISIPFTNEKGYSECEMYNVSEVEFDPNLDQEHLDITACKNGWVFDEEESGRTITAKVSSQHTKYKSKR